MDFCQRQKGRKKRETARPVAGLPGAYSKKGELEMTEKLKDGVPPLLRLWEARPKDFIALLCVIACWYLYQDLREEFRARREESRQTAAVLVELTAAIREHNPRLDHIERQLEAIRDDGAQDGGKNGKMKGEK